MLWIDVCIWVGEVDYCADIQLRYSRWDFITSDAIFPMAEGKIMLYTGIYAILNRSPVGFPCGPLARLPIASLSSSS
jgi:hypothetical protein